MAARERIVEGVRIDEAAASSVHEIGARLHLCKRRGVEHVARAFAQRREEADAVGFRQQRIERKKNGVAGRVCFRAAVRVRDFHAAGKSPPGYCGTDGSHAHDAERFRA